jgi:hypothetical protein
MAPSPLHRGQGVRGGCSSSLSCWLLSSHGHHRSRRLHPRIHPASSGLQQWGWVLLSLMFSPSHPFSTSQSPPSQFPPILSFLLPCLSCSPPFCLIPLLSSLAALPCSPFLIHFPHLWHGHFLVVSWLLAPTFHPASSCSQR